MQLKIGGEFNSAKIISKLGLFWKKVYIVLFFSLLLSAIGFGLYIWNRNVVSSPWNTERKQQFMKTQEQGIVLNEDKYKKALEIVEKRSQELSNTPEPGEGFF